MDNKRLSTYDLKIFNQIMDVKDVPRTFGTFNNKLDSFWCRNYKGIIKFKTSIEIQGIEPNSMSGNQYIDNFYMEITPKQAEEMIKELQKLLDNRKKRKK